MKQPKILLLDFDTAGSVGGMLRKILTPSFCLSVHTLQESIKGYEVDDYVSDFTGTISRFKPAMIFLVLSPSLLAEASVVLQSIKRESAEIPIIVAVEAGEPEEMFELLKLGAVDFITPPVKAIDILPRVWRSLGQACTGKTLTQTLKAKLGMKQLIGESSAFLEEITKIPVVANCDASVLISGETGTGKELCARTIHYLSPRASNPFVPVNCGAIPVELIENELFGHERGAFTGAATSQLGLIHEANKGTLFLDEIDCLPLLAQVKLLRFLQEKEYRPLGSPKMSKADIRIIAASNTDLEEAVRRGTLRKDLYYRLNIIPLRLPSLHERREDIPLLARHFLAKYVSKFNKQGISFSPEAIQLLVLYEWPGNVRELEHVIERTVVFCEQSVIREANILIPRLEVVSPQESFQEAKAKTIAQFEKTYIQGLLLNCHGNITKAAHTAHKNRRAFWELIRKHQIDVQSFKSSTH